MSLTDSTVAHHKGTQAPQRGPFVIKRLLEDVPLSADGSEDDIVINCVEYFGMLTITCAGKVL